MGADRHTCDALVPMMILSLIQSVFVRWISPASGRLPRGFFAGVCPLVPNPNPKSEDPLAQRRSARPKPWR